MQNDRIALVLRFVECSVEAKSGSERRASARGAGYALGGMRCDPCLEDVSGWRRIDRASTGFVRLGVTPAGRGDGWLSRARVSDGGLQMQCRLLICDALSVPSPRRMLGRSALCGIPAAFFRCAATPPMVLRCHADTNCWKEMAVRREGCPETLPAMLLCSAADPDSRKVKASHVFAPSYELIIHIHTLRDNDIRSTEGVLTFEWWGQICGYQGSSSSRDEVEVAEVRYGAVARDGAIGKHYLDEQIPAGELAAELAIERWR